MNATRKMICGNEIEKESIIEKRKGNRQNEHKTEREREKKTRKNTTKSKKEKVKEKIILKKKDNLKIKAFNRRLELISNDGNRTKLNEREKKKKTEERTNKNIRE